MVDFPLFLMWKDSGYFYICNDMATLMNAAEENDVRFEEFLLWGKNGQLLDYGEDRKAGVWLKESTAIHPDLATKLNEQLATRNLTLRVTDREQFTEAVKLLMACQQQEDRGLIGIGRKIGSWLWRKKNSQ